MKATDEFYTVEQAAAICMVTRSRVYQLIEAGRIRPQKWGAAYQLTESDIAALRTRKKKRGPAPQIA